ncbi:MAG: glycosyltransferase family 2 protein [Anaerolineae bacterium]
MMGTTRVEIRLPPVSVIIAAYNEQAFLGSTVASVLESGFPCELLVVDDGSTDRTPQILEAFGERIRVLRHPVNRGKGAAMASGLRAATGEIVVFCDAHLLGLRQDHLLSLVLPLVQGAARAALGVSVPRRAPLLHIIPYPILTGQRAYFREDLMPWVDEMEHLGYGVETFLFTRFSREETAVVLLPGLVHLEKPQTSSPPAAAAGYLRESLEIAETLAKVQGLAPARLTHWRQRASALLAKYSGTRTPSSDAWPPLLGPDGLPALPQASQGPGRQLPLRTAANRLSRTAFRRIFFLGRKGSHESSADRSLR